MVAQSSIKAEYFQKQLLLNTNQAIVDSQSAIVIAKNPVQHGRTKHIDVKFHPVREALMQEEINLVYCKSEKLQLFEATSKTKFDYLT